MWYFLTATAKPDDVDEQVERLDRFHAELMAVLVLPSVTPIDDDDTTSALGIRPPSWWINEDEAFQTSVTVRSRR